MTPEQKRLMIRSLELREEINTAAEDADTTPQTRELADVDKQLRAALAVQEQPVDQDAGESREREGLADRVELRHYLAAAASDGQLDGAEREYNAAQGLASGLGTSVPLALLQEQRADTNTAAPAVTAVTQSAIAGRLFAASVAGWLGVDMPTVPTGTRSYVYLSGGHTPKFEAESAAHDSTAATFSTRELAPKRLTGRYTFSVEDLSLFSGMESALRADLRAALADALDEEIVAGDGSGQHLSGLMDLTSGRITNPSDPTVTVTWSTAIAAVAGTVDGVHAAGLNSLRLLVGPDTFGKLAATWQTNGELSAYDYLAAKLGGVRVSKRVPAAVSNDARVLIRRGNRSMSAVAPIWDSVTIIRDPYSSASSGTVALTFTMLLNYDVVYPDAYQMLALQLA